MDTKLHIIVALGKQNQIGLNGTMPWHLREDLQNFKKLTQGHPIIMGRKTFESIGKTLPKRLNIVVTSQPEKVSGYNICPAKNIEQAIKTAKLSHKEIFIIGGANVYKQTLPLADKMTLTHVDYQDEADTFFPEINYNDWKIVSRKKYRKSPENDYDFEIVSYSRKK